MTSEQEEILGTLADTLQSLNLTTPDALVSFLRPAALAAAESRANAKVRAFDEETTKILADREVDGNKLREQARAEAAKFVAGV